MAIAALAPAALLAQTSRDTLEKDIQELIKGQAEIKKELAEIRKLVTPPPPPPVAEKLEAEVAIGTIAVRGEPGAPWTMIEFSDYQCPFCKRHVDQTVPGLVKDYVDTGKMRYAFRDFPLAQIHPRSWSAWRTGENPDEDGAVRMHRDA